MPAETRAEPVAPVRRPDRGHPTLRGRLLARLLPLVLVLMALSSGLSYFGARHYANVVYDRWLLDTAEALALRIDVMDGDPILDLPEAAREMLQWDSTDTTWYEVYSEQRGPITGQAGLPRPPAAAGQHRMPQPYDGIVGTQPVRVASVTMMPPGSGETIHVLVAETLRKRQALATDLMLSVLMPEIALLVAALLLVTWTLHRMLQPIGRIAKALEARTHHSLEPLDDRDLPGEVAPLTHAMNSLLLRLKGALVAQRHFIADAAHQLRTPLTALKLHTDEAARETDPTRLPPLIAELQKAADRAVRLSNQLLTLARAEPSANLTEHQRFDLREAVFETASQWIPPALALGVDLGFDAAEGPPIIVTGDRLLVTEAVNNLLDNALKYGRRQGRVTVGVDSGPRFAQICVVDDGPGIPVEARKRVLERFHRLEPTQVATAEEAPTGSGLGLAIVAEIARGHGGRTLLDTAPGGGLLACIELPLAGAPSPEPSVHS